MGQYYMVIARDTDGTTMVYDRSVDGEYTMAKLMEHSRWGNGFCSALSETLVDNPRKIAWVGDYAGTEECEPLGFRYEDVWADEVQYTGVKSTEFTLDKVKYLVNNDQKTYVDLAKYREGSTEPSGYVIHPIPLLTCIGNGRGGGDYHPVDDTHAEWVGRWAFCAIYLTNTLPEGYHEITPMFRERD